MGVLDAASAVFSVEEARSVVREGLAEALDTMAGMCGNPGQDTVFNDYVAPAFQEAVGPVNDGWNDVDIGEYMDFMGEIVDEGNSIMADAYDEAQAILSEIEEALEEAQEDIELEE